MNMRREAILWALAIGFAISLALMVIWGAIALAFGRPDLEPLYFSATHYHQGDYAADDTDSARLNPLDPALEQEVILEDLARGNLVLKVNYIKLADIDALAVATPTQTPPGPTSEAVGPDATKTPEPQQPSNTATPLPTNTGAPPGQPGTPAPSGKHPDPKPKKTPKPTKVKEKDNSHGHDPGEHSHGHGHHNGPRP